MSLKSLLSSWFILLILPLISFAQAPSAFQRSVVVQAKFLPQQAAVQFDWLADNTATGYTVYKKRFESNSWGDPIISLAGDATRWVDDQADTSGVVMEYAFFKEEFEPAVWQVCLPPGTPLKFEIRDMYGIGLCCSFGYGSYSVAACDSIYASGADFEFAADHNFDLCTTSDSCIDLSVTIHPDIFPNSTSWQLLHQTTNEVLATSGPVGTFISPRPAYGYIAVSKKRQLNSEKGDILLLVDSTWIDSLRPELTQLHEDLRAEGWKSHELGVNRQTPVVEVKRQIQLLANQFPDLQTLYIIGHVPVPYSGDIYPDTHTEHRGAWAADSYYADLDGIWTDSIVDRSTAFFAYNHNEPGDGKFDQGLLPSPVELAVGRVDFFDMPAFSESELTLLRRYLRKASRYKHGEIATAARALIDDNFLATFAAPAASGWRNFGPLVGIDSIFERDYFTSARREPYQWLYGCGSGTHVSSAGVGSTAEFANDSLQGIFSMLFGSQFGDFDNSNNFLRAPLASGTILTNCWAGNPPWSFHPMALGEDIGSCAKRTQNSQANAYLPGPQMVHVALMGDPTLGMHPLGSVQNLVIQQEDNSVELKWSPPKSGLADQYAVYRRDSLSDSYELLEFAVADTSFIDDVPFAGKNHYLVKSVRLQKSPSGSYYKTGMGLGDSLRVDLVITSQREMVTDPFQLYPNPSNGRFVLTGPFSSTSSIVRIFDQQGRLVWEEKTEKNSNRQQFVLPVDWVGVYWVFIENAKYKSVKKLVLVP